MNRGSNDDKTQIMNTRATDLDKTVVVSGPGSQSPAGGVLPRGQVIGQGLPQRPGQQQSSGGGGANQPPPPQQPGETIFIPGQQPGAAPTQGFNPVVGWLAIVRGPGRGECKPLFYGPNAIGRGDGHQVRLDNDQRVSRAVHGHVIYDAGRRKFFLRDNAANPIQYKGQLVMQPTEIANRDEFVIGETTLMFIALCNDGFDWVADAEAAKAGT